MELLQDYVKNEKEIEKLYKAEEKSKEEKRSIIYKTECNFRDRIWKLEEQRDKIKQGIEKQITEAEQDYKNKIDKLYETTKKVKRIIDMLRIKEIPLTVNDEHVHARNRGYGEPFHNEPLDFLYKDDYTVIKLYILGNDKPVNKYSLVAVGISLFYNNKYDDRRELIPFMRLAFNHAGHVDWFNDNLQYSIETCIKDFPTIEALKTWLEKNKNKILKDFLKHFPIIALEYEQVKKDYKLSDFDKLFQYKCNKCGFTLTEREVNSWSLHDNKCPKCDKKPFKKRF